MLYPQVIPPAIDKIFSHYTWRKKVDEKTVYLTFDDGPHPEITSWVLQQLKEHNYKATFFCVGDNVQKYPDTYRQILAEGHKTGNHTFNHLKGWKTPIREYVGNINQCRELVDSRLFRPPYGRITTAQTQVLKDGYEIIMWTLLSGDFYPTLNLPKALEKLKKKTEAGQIIVFHDSVKAEQNLRFLLPAYLKFLDENGFRAEALRDS